MNRWTSTTLLLSILVLFAGCGGGGPASYPPPKSQSVVSNWQFSTTSTVSGMPSLTIAGSITVSGSSISAAVRVMGSSCFDPARIVGLTGSLTGNTVVLNGSLGVQEIDIKGSVTDNALTAAFSPGQFTGTYFIDEPCGFGDQGTVIGDKIPYLANLLDGTFSATGGGTFDLNGNVAQDANARSGSFGVSGTATTTTSCFSSGTLTPGAFPSGSFIMGTSVTLEIKTANGTIAFLGTWDLNQGQISGTYNISGGTCDQTGAAVLVASSPWDY